MSTHPYIPLYVDDYEGATAHLTAEEDGIYMRMLRLQWRTPGCSFPAEPAWIARKVRVPLDDFDRLIGPLLEEFFTLSRGRYFQRRLKDEYEDITRKKNARKLAGKSGGDAKARKQKDNSPSIATDLLTDTRAFPEPEPEPKKEPKGSSSPSMFAKAWAAYPDGGRRRSAKGKAAEVWAKIADEAGGEGALLSAVQAYARTPDATRDGGQYAPAFERWLRDGKWEHYRGDLFSGEIGETDALPERMQRSWAEDWRDKGPNGWKRWERGPYPGEPGCRVSPAIIAEFTRERISA